MSKKFQVEVLTPVKEILTIKALEVILPTTMGQVGILPEHEDICGLLDTGVMKIVTKEKVIWLSISQGSYRVDNNNLSVLAHFAENGNSVNVELLNEKLSKLTTEISDMSDTYQDTYSELLTEKKRVESSLEAHRLDSSS